MTQSFQVFAYRQGAYPAGQRIDLEHARLASASAGTYEGVELVWPFYYLMNEVYWTVEWHPGGRESIHDGFKFERLGNGGGVEYRAAILRARLPRALAAADDLAEPGRTRAREALEAVVAFADEAEADGDRLALTFRVRD